VAASDDKKSKRTTESEPPAAPAFGFGAPAPAAAAKATSEEKKPSGISFGAPAPAAAGKAATTTPTAASTTGGFSFGGASSTPAPATPAGVATPGAPAPVATPNPNAANPALGTPLAAAALTPVAPREPPPLEYQTLTVEEILNKFQKQLEEDALAFADEAKRVCEYDAILRDNHRDLAKLTTEAQRMMIEQQQIEQGLDGIGAFQNQLEVTLSEVEEQVDSIFRAQGHLNPLDADKEREKAYEMAKGVEYRLDNVTESLRETFATLNQANARAFGQPSSGDVSGDHSTVATVGDVVHILNRHQDGLAELEAAAQKLELDCSEVHAVLATTRR
jgi:nuclear pore complex protein Nup62